MEHSVYFFEFCLLFQKHFLYNVLNCPNRYGDIPLPFETETLKCRIAIVMKAIHNLQNVDIV